MRKSLVVACLVLGVVAAATATGIVSAWTRAQDVRAHLARGETRLRLANPAGARLALYRAGSDLEATRQLPAPGPETWLTRESHFIEASLGPARWHVPIPLSGFNLGPDPGGSFAVTLRAPGPAVPPAAGTRSSRFLQVPAGHFAIGDRKNPSESHYVWVGAFHLGAFEVTNGEYRRFLRDSHGYDWRPNWTEAGWDWKTSSASQATAWLEASHPEYGRFGRDDLPVVLVTWYEANAYAHWLTARFGNGAWLFRLPTEAEWEKAARGPDSFDYGLGMTLSEPQAHLYNWKKNPGAEVTLVGVSETQETYRPNRFGVYHASGNAAEWTQSVHRPYNRERPYRAEDGRNEDATPGMRVTRGGSWYSANTVRLHLAYREEFQPELSSNDLGFRIAAVRLPAPTR
jgi:formylglycine-generating enzyme required for sulfatase activity